MRNSIRSFKRRWSFLAAAVLVAITLFPTLGKTQRMPANDTTCFALIDSMHKFAPPARERGGRGGRGGGERGTDIRSRALTCADQADMRRRMVLFDKLAPTIAALGQLPWMIPEYHDEQPFAYSGQYGPMAYIFASPFISGFKHVWQVREQGTRGFLAAIVHVDPPGAGGLSPAYTSLGLQPGLNCIWLANTGTGPGNWSASVSPGSSAQVCDRSVPISGTLDVKREGPGGFQHQDFPGAARFGEATSGQPLLGVQCLNGWCELGPPGFAQAPGIGEPGREGNIRGWHDVQRLSIRNASNVLRPGPRASIVPMPNLDNLSPADFATWKRVARIRFYDDPAGTKYGTWGLRLGVNNVEGRYSAGVWEYRVTPVGGTSTVWTHVVPMPHTDVAVPGTVRFRWTLLDEGIWIPCGSACCHADGE